MNLSKKTFLIIVPVIAVFFIAATAIVYQSQKNQITRLEKNRLKLALAELDTLYNQYNSFAESYLYTLTNSNSVKYYLQSSNDRYRRVALVRNLEDNLRNFKKHRSDYLSLTIARISPDPEIIEYIEISTDPFATMPDRLEQRAYNTILDQKFPRSGLILDGRQPFMAFSTLVDPLTLDPPLATQRNRAVSVSFAIEPTLFLNELARFEREFATKIRMESALPHDRDLTRSVSIELDDHLYLLAELSLSDLSSQLHPTRLKLVTISLIFLGACALVLFSLIKHLITDPIRHLAVKVRNADLQEGAQLELDYLKDDEIGRLAREFVQLYAKLSKAYYRSNHLLKTDHLTQLTNLYELNRDFDRRIEAAKKLKESLVFLYIDLDNFKFINDRYGHDVGDKVLIAFSDSVKKLLEFHAEKNQKKQRDWTFGRIAGDEFGIILSGSPSSIMINEICSDILAMFAGGFSFTSGKYPISASIGVVSYPKDGDSPSQLISNADTAMYQSKRRGKNRISHYSEQIALKLRREREIEHELKNANFNDEFYLAYLPIVDTQSLKVAGFETLLRWKSPQLGPVSPAEFIPIAEACGFFEAVDSWVIHQSFASYAQVRDILGTDFTMSINLSSAQIAINRVTEEILSLGESFDIPRHLIQFEMTETTGAEFSTGVDSLLHTITEAGFKLAIDDFGTGYTSLQQLVEYPASTIKFDKSFLNATLNADRHKILKPLIDLCHSQNLTVTVEGVETRDQYDYLRQIGVDHLQGFLFSQPVAIEELQGALITLSRVRTGLLQTETTLQRPPVSR